MTDGSRRAVGLFIYSFYFRYGVYIKKEQYQKEAFNPKTQQKVIATRTRATRRSFELRTDEAAGFLLTRFWPGPGPGPGVAPAGAGAAPD